MRLTTLALKNIKRNLKRYMMYFFSLGFSVFTAYSFFSLMQNEYVMMAFTYDVRYKALLKSFGIIIMVFVLFFLLSSNKSFIKARKKEISTYALFGMTNGRIGRVLFLETMLVGVTSLVIGIGVGVFFSKLLAMILLDISLESFKGDIGFTVSGKAIWVTIGMFLAIFSLMGLSGLRVINKFELVDLFKAEKVSEGRVKGSMKILILSLVLIGTGYFLAISSSPLNVVMSAIPILILVISGTYLFFWGGLPKVLDKIKNNKRNYYKGPTLISISAFSHRMKSIGTVMATISVLSAVATTAIATGFTLYRNIEVNTYDIIGYDMYFYGGQEEVLEDVKETIKAHGSEIIGGYTTQRYTCSPTISDPLMKGNLWDDLNYFRVYSESVYNELMQASHVKYKPIAIKSGEALYARGYIISNSESQIIGKELVFTDRKLKITALNKSDLLSFGAVHILVVSNDDFNALLKSGDIKDKDKNGSYYDKATVINYTKALHSKELNDQLIGILTGKTGGFRMAYTHYDESLQTFGLICFIGFFMSVVFILMTASLLYFKQIMAAEDEGHHYRMLRKIGMDEQVEKIIIRKRLIPVFLIPLLVGIIHSIFAMKTADTVVFSNMITVDNSYLAVLRCSAWMYGAYAIVYSLFYFITKHQYARIVK